MRLWTSVLPLAGIAACSAACGADRSVEPVASPTAPRPINAPAARGHHSAVWTGSRMIVWGGGDGRGAIQGDGAAYDPATDTWTAVRQSGAPRPRSGHVAFWTGTRMIVWGGFGSWNSAQQGSEILQDGAAYDPATDSWTPIAVPDAPATWVSYTAVWAGTRMILWGGVLQSGGGATPVNIGRIYHPATNTWTATSVSGAPDTLVKPYPTQVAAWSGSQMIVWDLATARGGAYDPTTDSWSPIESRGAPPASGEASAVWCGSSMLVWGGRSGIPRSGAFWTNLGAGYDPAQNVWWPLGTSRAPEPRAYHSAVSTGRAMIVWGGREDNSSFANGGIYDLQSGGWAETNTVGAPVSRMSHTAVWTGSRVIVWGGVVNGPGPNFGVTNTGGIYDPATDTWRPTATTAPGP